MLLATNSFKKTCTNNPELLYMWQTHSSERGLELLVKRPVLFSPRRLHQHANRSSCVPTVWKGPVAVYAKSLFWRTRWAKNMAASIRFPRRHLSVMKGRKQQWNKPLYILIICSAPGPNWNDGKITPSSVLPTTADEWIFPSCISAFSFLPSLHHTSPPPPPPPPPPPTGHMCCSAVL